MSIEDMLLTVYVDARTTKLYFCELFLAVPFYACQGSDGMAIPLQKGTLSRDIPSIGDAGCLPAFALLAPASLPSSS